MSKDELQRRADQRKYNQRFKQRFKNHFLYLGVLFFGMIFGFQFSSVLIRIFDITGKAADFLAYACAFLFALPLAYLQNKLIDWLVSENPALEKYIEFIFIMISLILVPLSFLYATSTY